MNKATGKGILRLLRHTATASLCLLYILFSVLPTFLLHSHGDSGHTVVHAHGDHVHEAAPLTAPVDNRFKQGESGQNFQVHFGLDEFSDARLQRSVTVEAKLPFEFPSQPSAVWDPLAEPERPPAHSPHTFFPALHAPVFLVTDLPPPHA